MEPSGRVHGWAKSEACWAVVCQELVGQWQTTECKINHGENSSDTEKHRKVATEERYLVMGNEYP